MISSTANKQVKFVNALVSKAKTRREEDLFVVEGIRMTLEAPKDRIRSVYASESFFSNSEHKRILDDFARVELVSDEVFRAMSDTKSPQGILALVKQYHYETKDILNQNQMPLLMILESLQDPGNLGTIIRAGEGAGVTGVIMDEGTADIYNPKVIRSTMGSIFRVPFIYTGNLPDMIGQVKKQGIHLFAAHLMGQNSYDQEDYNRACGFLIGNEAAGLSKVISELSDTRVRIPMAGKVESLNAAVASSVLMFEVARQRRL